MGAANILLDTTLGVGIEWCLLHGLERLLLLLKLEATAATLESGSYRDTAGAFRPLAYTGQMGVWLGIVSCMKFSIILLMRAFPVLVYFVHNALDSVNSLPRIKLFVVMICIPLVMNAFQFVLTDDIIKKRPTETEAERAQDSVQDSGQVSSLLPGMRKDQPVYSPARAMFSDPEPEPL